MEVGTISCTLWRPCSCSSSRLRHKETSVPASMITKVKVKQQPRARVGLEHGERSTTLSLTMTWGVAVKASASPGLPSRPDLDLTEDNIRLVLADARIELGQLFDTSVGMTGEAELAELDGPFVKISLKGRFWHKRSDVLARIGNYLRQRIPEILEVEIEDEKQLDDSPENF